MFALVTSVTGQQTGCDLGKQCLLRECLHACITPADLHARDLILNSPKSPRERALGLRSGLEFTAEDEQSCYARCAGSIPAVRSKLHTKHAMDAMLCGSKRDICGSKWITRYQPAPPPGAALTGPCGRRSGRQNAGAGERGLTPAVASVRRPRAVPPGCAAHGLMR